MGLQREGDWTKLFRREARKNQKFKGKKNRLEKLWKGEKQRKKKKERQKRKREGKRSEETI